MRLLHGLTILMVLNLWSCSALATDIYAIQQNGDMLFYKPCGGRRRFRQLANFRQ
jgi:hypothetical protein